MYKSKNKIKHFYCETIESKITTKILLKSIKTLRYKKKYINKQKNIPS